MDELTMETMCAHLCLLTRAAWREELPTPLTRPMAHRLYATGALCGLVLREMDGVRPELLDRARALLTRSRDVYDLLNAYRARDYRALLPEDELWPTELKALGTHAPLFLFARGNMELFAGDRIAVAGSRDIAVGTRDYARRVGARLAAEGITMVCGGARGVDAAAQEGLLDAGGRLILVPATAVEGHLNDGRIKRALDEGRLLILCDTLPDDSFSAQRALERNHIIYALGEAALVLAARNGIGGSWRGATDCLRGGYTPVFVPAGGDIPAQKDAKADAPDGAGCRALVRLGAKVFFLNAGRSIAKQTTGAFERQTRMF